MLSPVLLFLGECMETSESKHLVALRDETRDTVDTSAAAYYLNRSPQTLRFWASRETGPLRPRRVNGRLAWPIAEIRTLLGVSLASDG